MSEKVLLVDDDPAILNALGRHLRRKFDIYTAVGGAEALKLADTEGPFAVVMCDMTMPEINGIEVLDRFRETAPDTVRMMLTGNADQRTAVEAVNRGNIYRFFNKPCSADEIARGVEEGLRHYRLVSAERELLEKTLAGSIKVLTDVLSMVDHASFGAAVSIRDWAREIAPRLGLAHPWRLDMAAMLAPIGRVAVPPGILHKADAGESLSAEEQAMIDRVPEIGRDLIGNIPRMHEVAEIVYYQHKGFDGSGFPDSEAVGTEIPVESRVLKILNDLAKLSGGDRPAIELIDKLKDSAEQYCPDTLHVVSEWVADSEAAGAVSGRKQVEIPIKLLQPGYILLDDLKTPNGHLILSAGSQLSEVQVERLRNFQEAWNFEGTVRIAKTD